MILSRGLNYKTELIDQKIPLAARLESTPETTFLMTQIASDLLALQWLEPEAIQGLMQQNKHGYLFLDFPIQAGFREWYYGF